MRLRLSTVLKAVLVLAGISVMLYPLFGDYLNWKRNNQAVADYSQLIQNLEENDTEELLSEAEDYNRRLAETANSFFEPEQVSGYWESLSLNGSDVMGFIDIPRIAVHLPLYHGTESGVLGDGIGHLEGSSLPVGGENTHSVLVGHRGLPTANLFTDLDVLEIGDRFTVTVLGRTLYYQVDKISVVLPDEAEELQRVEGEDYCTLLTCTPYGINTHRLLVRGSRTEPPKIDTAEDGAAADAPAEKQPSIYLSSKLYAMAFGAFLLLLFGLVFLLRRRRKKKKI